MTLSTERGQQTEATPRPSPAELCREAVATLDRALQAPPRQVGETVDVAERQVARLRDELIVRLRQDGASAAAPGYRAALDRVNAALSLIVGVEYPAAGLHRKVLQQARDALHNLVV
jgi:hypothetical protein